jgi:hypothetical protein
MLCISLLPACGNKNTSCISFAYANGEKITFDRKSGVHMQRHDALRLYCQPATDRFCNATHTWKVFVEQSVLILNSGCRKYGTDAVAAQCVSLQQCHYELCEGATGRAVISFLPFVAGM